MNGKIKTKFAALFAVALMITVCVVPVVDNAGVDAAPFTVPSSDVDTIEISGSVYDAFGVNDADMAYMVTVSDGKDEYIAYSDVSGTANEYEVVMNVMKDTVIDEITVTLNASDEKIIDASGDECDNGAYGLWSSDPVLKFNDVRAGVELDYADFKAGSVAISGSLSYKNSISYKGSTTVTLYEVTEVPDENGGDPTYTYTSLNYTATSKDGSYVLYVPYSSIDSGKKYATGADITGSSYSSVAGVTISSNPVMNIVSADTYAFEFTSNALIKETVRLSAPTGSKVALSEDEVTITPNSDGSPFKTIIEYKLGTSGSASIKVTGDYAADLEVNSLLTTVTYNQTSYVEGTVGMDGVPALTGKVTLTFYKADNSVLESYDVDVTDGTFRVWYDNDYISSVPASAKIKYESGIFKTESEIESFIYLTAKTGLSIAVSDTGYSKVSGTVSNIAGPVSIAVNGTNVFGLKNNTVVTSSAGTYSFMAPNNTFVTITPDADYGYDVSSETLQIFNDLSGVNFTMDSKEVKISFKDYLGEPLSTVKVYKRTYATDGSLNALPASPTSVGTMNDGIVTISVPDNEDLSKYFVSFRDTKYTFANGDDTPIALSKIKGDVKVIDVRMNVQILDADGNEITEENAGEVVGISDVFVEEYATYIKNGIAVYDKVSGGKSYNVIWDPKEEIYYFVGVIGDQSVTATPNNILAIVMPEVESYIFDPIYPIVKNADTVIKSYRYSVSGTVYEADEKTVIKSIGGAEVSLYVDGNVSGTADATADVKKDGTFTVNTYSELTASSVITIETTGEYTFNAQKVLDDEKAVTSYYANETTFAVTFTDADGKAIEYTTAIVNGASVDDGKVIIAPTEGAPISIDGMPANRSFDNYEKITDPMISSKKIDFVSDQATYTVKLTDSKGNVWEKAASMTLVTVKDTSNTYDNNTFNIATGKGEAVAILNVPDEGESYAVKASVDTYFGTTEYAFTDYVVTVPAIGSYVDVTLAEANGTSIDDTILTALYIYLDDKQIGYADRDGNTGTYFAIEGKEYKFSVSDSSNSYSFGKADGDLISAVDGLLLANEETVKGQVTFANGYNIVPTLGINVLMKDGSEKTSVATISADTNGSYTAILDVSEVVKYTATGSVSGESATPDIVLKESYFTGAAPKDAVMKVALYKGDDFVKSTSVTSDGEYGFAMDVSEGDKIVMTITASGKTFQQAIDLKAVQNDIIVPGSLVSDKTNALFADFYVIYGADTAVIGSKIVLSAKNAISIQMDVANVAYTTLVFDGWYVNGEKISDDVNATYTVNGPCEVYAYYTEKVTETGAVADSSNGLSMDVLILGIVIVVLALLAFVYAVKFKKE